MRKLLFAAGALIAAGSSPVAADPVDDFAIALKDYTGEYNTAWVITKLTTFKVGKKCWAKLPDKDLEPLHTAAYYTRAIAAYAKQVTGDDWARTETQTGEREKDKKLVEPMIDAFRSKFALTISVEGDDCDAKSDGLWLRYWFEIGKAVRDYPPPKGGKVNIVLNVTTKVKDVAATVDKTGTSFTITAPRDLMPQQYGEKIEKVFRKVSKPL